MSIQPLPPPLYLQPGAGALSTLLHPRQQPHIIDKHPHHISIPTRLAHLCVLGFHPQCFNVP